MVRRASWWSVALVALLLGAGTSRAGQQDFTLVNGTGLTVVAVYVSPSDEESWEEDVLGVDVLRDGEAVEIVFSPKETARAWDLKIVDEDGDEAVWTGLRLDRISRVTLRYDAAGEPVADLE